MVVLIENMTRPLLASESFSEFNQARTIPAAMVENNKNEAAVDTDAATTVVDRSDSAESTADTENFTFPSFADEFSRLKNQNMRLQEDNLNLRRQLASHSALMPADTLDLALLVSVVALVVFVGKVALSSK